MAVLQPVPAGEQLCSCAKPPGPAATRRALVPPPAAGEMTEEKMAGVSKISRGTGMPSPANRLNTTSLCLKPAWCLSDPDWQMLDWLKEKQ